MCNSDAGINKYTHDNWLRFECLCVGILDLLLSELDSQKLWNMFCALRNINDAKYLRLCLRNKRKPAFTVPILFVSVVDWPCGTS